MCELLVGLGVVNVVGVDDVAGEPIRVYVETRDVQPDCEQCKTPGVVKDCPVGELGRSPCFWPAGTSVVA